jgi:cation diffusion facilitator CzcD-associated flavoprotein CzcO
MPDQSQYAIGIIGAGFAGLIAALQLQRHGRNDFVIFERADAIGGTWRDNIYPGCACDVPSYVYSIAEEPNPNWSRMYSPQAEIWAYMRDVVAKHGLEQHIRYGADIVHAQFNEAEGNWTLTDRRGRSTIVKAVIAALGPLNRPKLPAIAGIDSFAGPAFHTSQWDASIDLRGKRVAVIGTGASAIQVVPAIAPLVQELLVFQRTAAWIGPRNDKPIPEGQKHRFQRFPGLQRLLRNIIYEVMELRGRMFIGNAMLHRFFTRQSLKKLAREVHDPETRRKLTPDYKLGCKRILSSDDYLPAFNRENVQLVNAAIAEITPQGLRTVDGQVFEADILIFATGFEAAEIQADAQIIGRGGRDLFVEWAKTGMEAHRGTTFSGYPNLTYLLGPNTGLGHSSVLHVMESQMPYILQYLDLLDRQGAQGFLDVRPEAQARYNADLQARFAGTVWASGCHSWYLNSQGKNTTLYPRLTREFRKRMARLDAESYVMGGSSASQ